MARRSVATGRIPVLVPLGMAVVAAGCGWLTASGNPAEPERPVVAEVDPAPWFEARSGGATTTFREGADIFGLPSRNLGTYDSITFAQGRALFNESLAPHGLGPLVNAESCLACHRGHGSGTVPGGEGDGPGGPVVDPGLLVRLSIPGVGPHGEPLDEPTYGGQVQDRSVVPDTASEATVIVTYDVSAGAFGDGTPFSLRRPRVDLADLVRGPLAAGTTAAARVAPPVIGLGLLEAIPETVVLEAADPDDADGNGVSGRPNRVWDRGRGQPALGRFGWKAAQPNVDQQTSAALDGDLGVTSPLYSGAGGESELSITGVYPLTFYTQSLAVPAARDVQDPEVRRGAALFESTGCGACHRTTVRTGPVGKAAFADQVIHPYTDLLLHDMGDGLADGRQEFDATGKEWRTPPLWGLGRRREVSGVLVLLHDGRARTVSEAILWHGGEGAAAQERFRTMAPADRAALLRFLDSL